MRTSRRTARRERCREVESNRSAQPPKGRPTDRWRAEPGGLVVVQSAAARRTLDGEYCRAIAARCSQPSHRGDDMSAALTRRAHRMPFGAEPQADGRVRFRLWAPTHGTIRLALDGEADPLPMQAQDHGWHELVTDRARPGTRYRFVLPDGGAGARPGLALPARGRARAERGRRPARLRLDATRGWQGRPLGRGGALRAACRRVHGGGHVPRGHRRSSTTWRRSASPPSS